MTVGNVRSINKRGAAQPAHARYRFGAVLRFLDWCMDEGHVVLNICATIGKGKRAKPWHDLRLTFATTLGRPTSLSWWRRLCCTIGRQHAEAVCWASISGQSGGRSARLQRELGPACWAPLTMARFRMQIRGLFVAGNPLCGFDRVSCQADGLRGAGALSVRVKISARNCPVAHSIRGERANSIIPHFKILWPQQIVICVLSIFSLMVAAWRSPHPCLLDCLPSRGAPAPRVPVLR